MCASLQDCSSGTGPKSKSRSCTTKLPTSERILYTSRRTTLAKTSRRVRRDLSIRNMSKSGRGSQENHGKNVKQKSGLKRETRRNSLPSGKGYQEMAETPAVLFNASPGLSPPVDRS